MAHVEDDSETLTSISASAHGCITAFQYCLDNSTALSARETSLVEDQLARFSLWTASLSVFALGQNALDLRLRDGPGVRDTVIGILESVDFYLQECTGLLQLLGSAPLGTEFEHAHIIFQVSLNKIDRDVNLLCRFSMSIRTASRQVHDLTVARKLKIVDKRGCDVELFLQWMFACCVKDYCPLATESIRRRLARAMVLQRKLVLFRQSRLQVSIKLQSESIPPGLTKKVILIRPSTADKFQTAAFLSSQDLNGVAMSSPTFFTAMTNIGQDDQELAYPSSPLKPDTTTKESKSATLSNPKNQVAKVTNQTARYQSSRRDMNEILQDVPFSRTKSEPTKLTMQGATIPPSKEITCPICFHDLLVDDIADEQNWRLHVMEDLDIYVCLEENCDHPDDLSNNKIAWLNHAREHANRWRCVSKSHSAFETSKRDQYLDHMRNAHPRKFSEEQLNVLADRKGKAPAHPYRCCPLCGKKDCGSNAATEDHIIDHLTALATRSLPRFVESAEDPQNYKSQASNDDSNTQDRGASNKNWSGNPIEEDSQEIGGLSLASATTMGPGTPASHVGAPTQDELELLPPPLANLTDSSATRNTWKSNVVTPRKIQGHETEVLLDTGADVNAPGGYYGNVLQAASCGGHKDLVKLLVDAKVNVNARGSFYGTALQAASYRGHIDIVQLLLNAGADINAQGGYFGNALQAASDHGNKNLVQLLLDAGARVDAKGGHYGNTLQAASDRRHRDVVRMLSATAAKKRTASELQLKDILFVDTIDN